MMIEQLKDLVKEVVAVNTQNTQAKSEEVTANAAMLDTIVRLVKPILRPLSTRVVKSFEARAEGNKLKYYHDQADQGVLIHSIPTKDTRSWEQLYIFTEGKFVLVQYEGDPYKWTTRLQNMEATTKYGGLAADQFTTPEKLCAALIEAISTWLRRNPLETAQKMTQRAEKLRALTFLLDGREYIQSTHIRNIQEEVYTHEEV